MAKKKTDNKEESGARGRITGGKWMGRIVTVAQQLAYNVGFGTGTAVAGGRAAIEGLCSAICELARGNVTKAQQLGAMISKSTGASFAQLKGLDQKPFADNDAPSLAGMLTSAFSAGASDAARSVKASYKEKGTIKGSFSTV